ncbi:MAG: DUF547 domain-containing protein [Planctomycetes bacterium]|nr:DUF547 domain-containing protein [Planctomycetota bacterium]
MNFVELTSTRDTAGSSSPGFNLTRLVRLGSIVVVLICVLAVVRLLPVGRLTDWLGASVSNMGVWGPLVFAAVYVVATILMIPGSALTLGAGAIFGLWWGTAAVSVGSTAGAAMAFLVARYLARRAVERKLSHFPKFRAVDRAVSEGGWKIVALLRLSPAIPFNIQNYLYGLTAIGFWPCVLTSWIAMLPGTFMYVYLGYAGRAGVAAAAGQAQGRSPAQWTMLAVGLLATIIVTVYVTKLARRAMARQADDIEPASQGTTESQPMNNTTPSHLATIGYITVALLAVALTGCAYANQHRLLGLFGPPPVDMAETYAAQSGGPSFDHSAFDALLRKYVNDKGGVDYAGLMRDRDRLSAYVKSLDSAPFEQMGRDQKLALLINAYNAFTLTLILDHYDGGKLKSIRDIPDARRWDAVRWKFAGQIWSLNQIEHEQIRPHFAEPRIHFALVCAAVGCPPLRSQAYVADRLEQQLADQARYVHTHDRWYRLDAEHNAVHLTQLYNWYGGDFKQAAESVLAFAARYAPALKQRLNAGQTPTIQWLDYDWSLNSRENLP